MKALLLLLLAACAAPAPAPARSGRWCFADQERRLHCAATEGECETQRKAMNIMLFACQER